jgi:hypothetical protein
MIHDALFLTFVIQPHSYTATAPVNQNQTKERPRRKAAIIKKLGITRINSQNMHAGHQTKNSSFSQLHLTGSQR